MEITLQLNEVLNLNQTLKTIIDGDNKVDALLKFKLLGIMKSIESNVINFETIRNEKIKEYGKENEEGNIGISKDDTESLKKFEEDLTNVLQSNVVINITKLKSTEIFNKGVTADYLIGLLPIIEE
jgi:hypothetical protein